MNFHVFVIVCIYFGGIFGISNAQSFEVLKPKISKTGSYLITQFVKDTYIICKYR